VSSRIDGDLIIARVRVKGGKGSMPFSAPSSNMASRRT
jgi:hypothetical protein